jgi:preprotein translocase subunit SecB
MSETAPPPPIFVHTQYVKDLSFEVPNAPHVFTTLRSQPQINLGLDVRVQKLPPEGQGLFEVVLHLRAEAYEGTPPAPGEGRRGDGDETPKPVFIAELAYGGVFGLANVPENAMEPVLLVECPRLLFPFARSILAEVTRDGGFPPMLLQPIDFVALWQQRRLQAAQQAAATA